MRIGPKWVTGLEPILPDGKVGGFGRQMLPPVSPEPIRRRAPFRLPVKSPASLLRIRAYRSTKLRRNQARSRTKMGLSGFPPQLILPLIFFLVFHRLASFSVFPCSIRFQALPPWRRVWRWLVAWALWAAWVAEAAGAVGAVAAAVAVGVVAEDSAASAEECPAVAEPAAAGRPYKSRPVNDAEKRPARPHRDNACKEKRICANSFGGASHRSCGDQSACRGALWLGGRS